MQRKKDAQHLPPEIGEEIPVHDLETSWRVWQIMEVTNWAWAPDVVLRQPEWLLEDLLIIAANADKVERMRDR